MILFSLIWLVDITRFFFKVNLKFEEVFAINK